MFSLSDESSLTDLGGGVSRKILAHDEKMMCVEVHFKTGAVGASHSHPHSQICYVLEGEFEATLGDATRIIRKGDTYITEPNLVHGVKCLKEGILLDIFTPRRDDFLA